MLKYICILRWHYIACMSLRSRRPVNVYIEDALPCFWH